MLCNGTTQYRRKQYRATLLLLLGLSAPTARIPLHSKRYDFGLFIIHAAVNVEKESPVDSGCQKERGTLCRRAEAKPAGHQTRGQLLPVTPPIGPEMLQRADGPETHRQNLQQHRQPGHTVLQGLEGSSTTSPPSTFDTSRAFLLLQPDFIVACIGP
jgi:hypothetical protein